MNLVVENLEKQKQLTGQNDAKSLISHIESMMIPSPVILRNDSF